MGGKVGEFAVTVSVGEDGRDSCGNGLEWHQPEPFTAGRGNETIH